LWRGLQEAKEMGAHKFWTVFVDGTAGGYGCPHDTLESARQEAERLAKMPGNRGKKVYVLELVGFCQSQDIPVTWKSLLLITHGREVTEADLVKLRTALEKETLSEALKAVEKVIEELSMSYGVRSVSERATLADMPMPTGKRIRASKTCQPPYQE